MLSVQSVLAEGKLSNSVSLNYPYITLQDEDLENRIQGMSLEDYHYDERRDNIQTENGKQILMVGDGFARSFKEACAWIGIRRGSEEDHSYPTLSNLLREIQFMAVGQGILEGRYGAHIQSKDLNQRDKGRIRSFRCWAVALEIHSQNHPADDEWPIAELTFDGTITLTRAEAERERQSRSQGSLRSPTPPETVLPKELMFKTTRKAVREGDKDRMRRTNPLKPERPQGRKSRPPWK